MLCIWNEWLQWGWKLQKKLQVYLSCFSLVSFQALENSKAWASQEHDKLVNKLKMAIQDKDKTIGVSNQLQTAWHGITVPNFLSDFVILMAMTLNYSKKFCFFFCQGISRKWTRKGQDVKSASGMFVNGD